jgi:D-tagatose-1,6-bisphosphate aldolase subunit GatZ/KbaZ
VQRACEALFARLDRRPIPLTLLSQYLPRQHDAVRSGRIAATTAELLREGVAHALRPYIRACGDASGAAA